MKMELNLIEKKEKPLLTKVHPKFHELVKKIQNDRIRKGKETTQDKIPLWRITKTISNMITSNLSLYESLVEVNINV